MKEFKAQDLPISESSLEEAPLHGELNVEQLVFRQIERTYLSALQDEALFASNVRLLLSTVPAHKRDEILERSEEYTNNVERYVYKYWCGVPLGTPKKPVNDSPYLVKEEVVDWHQLFEIILKAFEDCGLTWKFEKWTEEVGRVPDNKPLPTPTPVFNNKFSKQKTQEQVESIPTETTAPPKQMRPCSICTKHVDKGTGRFYKHHLVHIEGCLELAKSKWGPEES